MMGELMTDGEQLHAQNRKRLWRSLFIGGLFAAPIGAGVGFGLGKSKGDINAFWTMAPDWLVIVLVLLAAGGFLFGLWRFDRAIDEVERVDNLWSSTAAYTTYAVLFPAWWAFGKAGITGEPNGWAIYLAALVLGLVAYGKRKWDAR